MSTTPFVTHAPVIGRRLFAVAVSWSREGIPGITAATEQVASIKGRKAVINGSRAKRAAAEATLEAAEACKAAAEARKKARRRAGVMRRRQPHPDLAVLVMRAGQRGGLCKRLSLPLSTRLARMRIMRVSPLARGLRLDQAPDIILTTDPARVGVEQGDYLDWNYYSKATKYPKKIVNTTITVPAQWISRVEKRGLAQAGGMMTLDAQPLESRGSIELFAAVWVVQGRGYQVEAVRGVIACEGDVTYHGADADQAIAGLRRKAAWAKLPAAVKRERIARLQASAPETFAKRYRGIRAEVCIADAQAIGACEYGIRSWCEATGLDYDAGCETLDRVLDAYIERPQPEARQAILHAVRRARHAA